MKYLLMILAFVKDHKALVIQLLRLGAKSTKTEWDDKAVDLIERILGGEVDVDKVNELIEKDAVKDGSQH